MTLGLGEALIGAGCDMTASAAAGPILPSCTLQRVLVQIDLTRGLAPFEAVSNLLKTQRYADDYLAQRLQSGAPYIATIRVRARLCPVEQPLGR